MLGSSSEFTYTGEIVIPDMPPQGRWEMVGADLVRRNPGRSEQFQIRIKLQERRWGGSSRRVWVAVGWLPLLQIGSVWAGGKCVDDRLAGSPAEGFDLDIGPESLVDVDPYIRGNFRDREGREVSGFLIPVSALEMAGINASRFRMIGVRVGNDRLALIIPNFVLYHFYFAGVSNRLSEALFSGNIDRCFDAARSGFIDRPGGHFYLHQDENVRDADCWTIARVAADREGGPARRAFHKVHSSLVAAHVNNAPMEPTALFPFEGRTHLKVVGRRLPRDLRAPPQSPDRFFVLRIVSCSGAFPYQKLSVRRMENEPDPESEQGNSAVPVYHASPPSALELTDAPPDRRLRPHTVEMASPIAKFVWIEGMTLEHRIERQPAASAGPALHRQGESSGRASVGAPSSNESLVHPLVVGGRTAGRGSGDAQPRDYPEEREPRICSKGVRNFLAMLYELGRHDAIDEISDIRVHRPFRHVDDRHAFGSLPRLGKRHWHLIRKPDLENPNPRPRLAMAVEIHAGNQSGYLFDIEPRENDISVGSMMLVLPRQGRRLSAADLESLINCMRSIRRGWSDAERNVGILDEIDKVRSMPNLADARFVSIEHNRSEVGAYVEEICRHLTAAAGSARSMAQSNNEE